MKKTLAALAAVLLLAVLAVPALAASDWNEFVADMQKRDKIKETGAAVLQRIRGQEPSGSESELWSRLWSGEASQRAAAGLARGRGPARAKPRDGQRPQQRQRTRLCRDGGLAGRAGRSGPDS